MSDENTGLECEFCGARQKRLNIQRMLDGGMVVHVSVHIEAGKVRRELAGLRSLLKMFEDGTTEEKEPRVARRRR